MRSFDKYMHSSLLHVKDNYVEYFNEDDEFSNLICLPKEEYLNKLEVVDKELVKDIISIIAYDNKKLECLYDELFT